MPKLTIAIDGPAGSGKSSVARRVAAMIGYLYLDSGAMYRALALKAVRRGTSLSDERGLEALAKETHIELKPPRPEQEAAGAKNCIFLDGVDVTQEIRTPEVAQAASRLATIAGVRRVLVAEQQRAGAGGGIVMEGRDIGTIVFPKAELKIFLDASPEVRAERRWKEHQEKGDRITLAEVFAQSFAARARFRCRACGQHRDGHRRNRAINRHARAGARKRSDRRRGTKAVTCVTLASPGNLTERESRL